MDLDCRQDLEKIFGTEIKKSEMDLFRLALTHLSYAKENNTEKHYERLEFLGDAVLKLCISEILYNMYPNYREGEMSKIRSIVVSDSALSKLSDKLGLPKYMILGHQEEKMGGRNKQSIKACSFEALLGAFYLCGKFKNIEEFLKENFLSLIKDVDKNFDKFNSKAVLQEYTQGINKTTPEYKIIKEEGPDHKKIFTAEVIFNGKTLAQGKGPSKQEAEKQAAFEACKNFNITKEQK